MSKSMFSLSYSMWSLLNFVHLQIHVLYQIWKIFSHYFFKYVSAPISFSSSSRTITIMYKNLWYCPTGLWESVHFLSNFFSSVFSRLDNFYWLTFKLIGPFFSSPPFCFWGLLVDILVLLLCLSIQKFPLGSLAYLFLCWKCLSSFILRMFTLNEWIIIIRCALKYLTIPTSRSF